MRQFDKNGDGVIDRSFVPEALKLFGVITTGYEATKICDYFDKNGDGKLQISELTSGFDVLIQHSVHGKDLLTAFHKFDKNQNGFIEFSELKVK
ncbi:hypothetical protein EB796_018043 [Bugula neritina]|uniref:EF-hand domain-containing protein n=1 Tax=Bugula neritina TaxID=10212 RepID=A0A7J7JDC1_BUGNE|nr:hypothetical protein EB796_018043 [Bugula neritina]